MIWTPYPYDSDEVEVRWNKIIGAKGIRREGEEGVVDSRLYSTTITKRQVGRG